jgi:hypothetical protein
MFGDLEKGGSWVHLTVNLTHLALPTLTRALSLFDMSPDGRPQFL